VAEPERATWHADVSMTSPGDPGLLTSAVGPADASVDRSTVNCQRSRWGPWSTGPTGQPYPKADRWAPRVRPGKRKKRKGYGLKVSWAGSVGPTSPASARGVSSSCSLAGWLGPWAGWPQRLGRDENATSRPCRGVAAHGEAVAGAWRGWGGLGSVWPARSKGRRGPCRLCLCAIARRPGLPGSRLVTSTAARR
jgi:hypothetical protein